jgi:hypothetical protein
MALMEERVDTVDTVEDGIGEIKDRLGVLERSVGNIEKPQSLMRDDVADLKAGQIEIRDLLARVVARLEGVDPKRGCRVGWSAFEAGEEPGDRRLARRQPVGDVGDHGRVDVLGLAVVRGSGRA